MFSQVFSTGQGFENTSYKNTYDQHEIDRVRNIK